MEEWKRVGEFIDLDHVFIADWRRLTHLGDMQDGKKSVVFGTRKSAPNNRNEIP